MFDHRRAINDRSIYLTHFEQRNDIALTKGHNCTSHVWGALCLYGPLDSRLSLFFTSFNMILCKIRFPMEAGGKGISYGCSSLWHKGDLRAWRVYNHNTLCWGSITLDFTPNISRDWFQNSRKAMLLVTLALRGLTQEGEHTHVGVGSPLHVLFKAIMGEELCWVLSTVYRSVALGKAHVLLV